MSIQVLLDTVTEKDQNKATILSDINMDVVCYCNILYDDVLIARLSCGSYYGHSCSIVI